MPARSRKKRQINFEHLYKNLKSLHQSSESALLKKHKAADKFFTKHGLRPGKIRDHARKVLATGALAGSLMLSPLPISPISLATPNPQTPQVVHTRHDVASSLAHNLQNILSSTQNWQLTTSQEEQVSDLIYKSYGIKAYATLDGNKLNNSYGRMGAEQHLPRYPGDDISQHERLFDKGITPGKSAWGYFAYSKSGLTQELIDTEKYYVAVQTLYLPNWKTDLPRLRDWYKYRRVVVVNPANGKAIVAAVADAGPSDWTGKHFGGSPEVVEYLGINYGKQNHPVVLFFLDGKDRQIPLGPLEYNVHENNLALANKT